jgi:hypothetical protein
LNHPQQACNALGFTESAGGVNHSIRIIANARSMNRGYRGQRRRWRMAMCQRCYCDIALPQIPIPSRDARCMTCLPSVASGPPSPTLKKSR